MRLLSMTVRDGGDLSADDEATLRRGVILDAEADGGSGLIYLVVLDYGEPQG